MRVNTIITQECTCTPVIFYCIGLLDKTDINHVVKLKEIVNNPECVELSTRDTNLFIQYMADIGYFNIVYREYDDINYKQVAHLKILSKEIYNEIKSFLF